eukprot:GILK01006116.1.p1 GENE.GILK01006116.1~~GILK01006116.1.p1  ORF type:complete len:293 (-),score=44.29 GILK01006116.1:254-1069(-)
MSQLSTFLKHLKTLFECRVYVHLTLALCSLYFIVTGIEYWITAYITKVLHADRVVSIVSFSVTAITAPIAGVFFGGALTDRLGGYRGERLEGAVRLCVHFGAMAVAFSVPIGFVPELIYLIPLTWILLFFGGAVMPTAAGILISVVPTEIKAFSSAVSIMAYNLFGFFLSPILSGAVMDAFDDELVGLTWGFRLILLWSFFGFGFMVLAWYAAGRQMHRPTLETMENSARRSSLTDMFNMLHVKIQHEHEETTAVDNTEKPLERRKHSASC